MRSVIQSLVLSLLLVFHATAFAGPVNVNTATAATLAAELKGVGEKTAKAIVEYRETHGPFRTLDDLAKVKGVGSKVLENNKDDIRFSDD